MKYTITWVLLFFMHPIFAQEYLDLNGTWNFGTDLYENGKIEKWYANTHDYANWETLEVPGNWDIENEYAYYIGTAWYQKSVDIHKGEDKHFFLQCESIYNDSEIYINGAYVGENHAGFLPFEFHINEFLKEGTNNITIRVNNSFKRGALWNWGGIRRPIRIQVTTPIRLERHHITAVPEIKKKRAETWVDLKLKNHGSEQKKLEVIHTLAHKDSIIGKESRNIVLGPSSEKKIVLVNEIRKAFFWHFNHPHLYHSKVEIMEDGKTIFTSSQNFGIRSIEVKGSDLLLNGETIKPVGLNLVPDDRIYGNSYPGHRIKEDVALLKQLGCQMARLSHLPLPKEFLDELDKQGIMTFEEVSLWGKDKMVDPDNPVPFEWLERMVAEKYNHPSVIGWSVGNEIGYKDVNPKVMAYVKKAIDKAHELDSTRLAVYVTHSADSQNNDPVIYSDLVMLNKYGNYGIAADNVHKRYPDKPIFFSEFGKQLNDENPDNKMIPIDSIYAEMRQRPFVIGAAIWTFNDYRSTWKAKDTWNTPPSENRAWGIVTTFRQKKKQFSQLQREHLPFIFEHALDTVKGIFSLTTAGRPPSSFPHYEYDNYRSVVKIQGATGNLLKEVSKSVQELLRINFDGKKAATLNFSFQDPQGFTVYDKVLYLTAPEKPVIKKVHTAAETIRVIYDKVKNAKRYKATVTDDKGREIESDVTINTFIDINSLKFDTKYRVALVAMNEAGTTESENKMVQTDEDELPPIIWSVKSVDGAAMINYSVDHRDLSFQFRYGTEPGKYDRQFELRNFGAAKIPNLKNGVTYYLQMNRRRQWGFESEWSHEVVLRPKQIENAE